MQQETDNVVGYDDACQNVVTQQANAAVELINFIKNNRQTAERYIETKLQYTYTNSNIELLQLLCENVIDYMQDIYERNKIIITYCRYICNIFNLPPSNTQHYFLEYLLEKYQIISYLVDRAIENNELNIQDHDDIYKPQYNPFIHACTTGNNYDLFTYWFDVGIKYAKISKIFVNGFIGACENHNYDIIKAYLENDSLHAAIFRKVMCNTNLYKHISTSTNVEVIEFCNYLNTKSLYEKLPRTKYYGPLTVYAAIEKDYKLKHKLI